MTDREKWLQAWHELTLTTDSYPAWKKKGYPASSHWAKAKAIGDTIGVTPPPAYGSGLPKRSPASTGQLREVTTLTALVNTYATCDPGDIVRSTQAIDGLGRDLVLSRAVAYETPITVDLAAPFRNGRVLISRAASLNLRATSLEDSPIDSLKITDGARNIDVDLRGGQLLRPKRQGLLVTGADTRDWQVWNTRARNCGGSTLDHSYYIGSAVGDCVLGNPYGESPLGYNLQIQYADVASLIVSNPTFVGGVTQRGGIIYSEHAANARVYGALVSGCKTAAADTYNGAVSCFLYDSAQWNNAGGFVAGNGLSVINPGTSATKLIDPSRYPFVPPTDIDGRKRSAGAYAGCVGS